MARKPLSKLVRLVVPGRFRRTPRWAAAAAAVLAGAGMEVTVAAAPPFLNLAALHGEGQAVLQPAVAEWLADATDHSVVILSPALVSGLRRRLGNARDTVWEWHEAAAMVLAPAEAPQAQRVLVFLGCYGVPDASWHQAMEALLKAAGLDRWDVVSGEVCCGGAHSLVKAFPALADALLERSVAVVKRRGPDVVLVPEPQCRERLALGVREAKIPAQVWHPAEWLVNGREGS